VPVDVEICFVTVHAFAHVVGQPAHSENVAGSVKGEGIVSVKPLAGHDFGMNRLQSPVVSLKTVLSHPPDDIARRCRSAITSRA